MTRRAQRLQAWQERKVARGPALLLLAYASGAKRRWRRKVAERAATRQVEGLRHDR